MNSFFTAWVYRILVSLSCQRFLDLHQNFKQTLLHLKVFAPELLACCPFLGCLVFARWSSLLSSYDLIFSSIININSFGKWFNSQVSIPLGLHDNLPVSVSLLAKHGSDGFLLNLVQALHGSIKEQVEVAKKTSYWAEFNLFVPFYFQLNKKAQVFSCIMFSMSICL